MNWSSLQKVTNGWQTRLHEDLYDRIFNFFMLVKHVLLVFYIIMSLVVFRNPSHVMCQAYIYTYPEGLVERMAGI